jgi:Zn-dependent protease
MHAFAGYWLGDDTAKLEGRISLNPLRHVDPFGTLLLPAISLLAFGFPLLAAKPVPFNPARVKFEEFGAALVGIAGPLTNLILALTAAAIIRTLGVGIDINVFNVLYTFLQINVILFVFNMIPLPPLDGSRLLYAFAPEGLQNAMAQLEQFGVFIVFGLILFVPVFSDFLVNLYESVIKFLV